jgi:hypothetical protein
MRRKLLAGIFVGMVVAMIPAAALADDCGNFSRTANHATPWETTRGRWTLIDTEIGTFWVFDKPGDDQALLQNAKCPTARLTGQLQGTLDASNLKGIWSEDCFVKAVGG